MRWKRYEVELQEKDKTTQKYHKWSRAAGRSAKWSHTPAKMNAKMFESMIETHASVMNSNPKGSLWKACADTGSQWNSKMGK